MEHFNSSSREGSSPCPRPSADSTQSFWHSQPSALLKGHRSTRNLPQTADVVIIGSGITGTSVAYNLLTSSENCNDENGPSVVMLEAREACWGATGRNGGHCLPILFDHPHDPSIGDFELANFNAIRSLVSEKNIDCEFNVQPGVEAIYTRDSLNAIELALMVVKQNAPEQAKMMRIVTDPKELVALRIPTALGAVVTNLAARLWPYKLVTGILEDLLTSNEIKGSFNLQTLTPVECLAQYDSDRWTVKTDRGCIVAKKVVLATNAYTSHLLPDFADLIVPVRGQMSALVPPPLVAKENRLKTSFGFIGGSEDDYLIQRPNELGGHLMFGGGRKCGESVGVADDSVVEEKVAEYLRGRLVETLGIEDGQDNRQWSRCLQCNNRRPAGRNHCKHCGSTSKSSITALSTVSHPKELHAAYEWTGIMGFSRDSHPWVGELPSLANVYIAAGFTGHGMPNTWLCGKYISILLDKSLNGSSRWHYDTSVEEHDANIHKDPDRGRGVQQLMKMRRRAVISEYKQAAAKEVGLPKCYVVDAKRIQRAGEMETVRSTDDAEMARAQRKRQDDRMPSGYA